MGCCKFIKLWKCLKTIYNLSNNITLDEKYSYQDKLNYVVYWQDIGKKICTNHMQYLLTAK